MDSPSHSSLSATVDSALRRVKLFDCLSDSITYSGYELIVNTDDPKPSS